MIKHFAAISRLQRVPVPHTNDAVYALTDDGLRWVAKREMDMGSEALLAEAISWLLARAIGAPVPDAAFCAAQDERSWLSAWLPEASHWSPRLAAQLANPEEAGAIFTLDCWVWNEARHSRNLLAEGLRDGRFRLWAIDADEALVGHVDDFIDRLAGIPSVRNHARGLPLQLMESGAHAASERAARLSREDIASLVLAACAVGREPRTGDLTDALLRRAGILPELVRDYLRSLETLR